MAHRRGSGPVFEADFRLALKENIDVLSASERVDAILGYKPKEFLSSAISLEGLVHPHDAAVVRQLFSPSSNDESGELKVRVRHADGRIRCLSWIFEREKKAQGLAILNLILRDATRLPHKNTDPRTAAELMALMEGMDECAYRKDWNHVITLANRNFRRLFSNASEEPRDLTGLTDYDLFSEEYADQSYELEEQVLAGQPVAYVAHQTVHGSRERLDHRKFPVYDPQGQITGLFTIIAVTTERAQAERTLRANEESLRGAQRVAGIGTFVLDIQGRVWTASDVLYEILGIDKGCERTLAVWTDLIRQEDLAALVKLYGEMVLGQSKMLDGEARFIRRADKTLRWARVRGRLALDELGRPHTLRGSIEDISDRKLAEAELRQSSGLLELFIQDAPTGLAMFNREMRYICASRRWIEDMGVKEWSVAGKSHYELGYKIPERWKEQHRRALEGETVSFNEDCYESEDGSERWVRRMVRPWWTGYGTVGGIVVLSEDITERKANENALRESEKSLNEAQRIAGVGSYVLDLASGVWSSSETLDEILGIDGVYSHTVDGWKALIHLDDSAMMASHLVNEVLGKAMQFSKEYRIVRPSDGAVRWVQGLGELETDALGNPTHLRGTIQEITTRKEAEASLWESRELLQLFIEHAPVAIAMFDREMRYVAASHRWLENYALAGKEIRGRSHYDDTPEIPERWKEAHCRGLNGEAMRAKEDRFVRADGTKRWSRWELVPWRAADGTIGGIVLFTEDITALKESEDRLQLAANVFTHASEGILITDAEGAILDANNAFTRITGYTRAEVLGQNPRMLKSGRQSREFYAEMWALLKEKGHWSGEVWNRAKGGQIFAEMLTISAVPDAMGRTKQYVAMFSDLTPIKETEKQLKHIAHFDVLTGLPNRTLLADRLRQAMAQSHRLGSIVAVAYLDLDDFRAVNDLHGHNVGDQLLTAITLRMGAALRDGDTLARIGGDEFAAVLLEIANIEESLDLIARLRDAVAEPVRLGEVELRVSASMGVTFYPQAEDAEPDQLLRQADQAMYFAKLAGKERYHIFDPTLDRSMRGRHEDLQRIRQAMKAQEFELYFQPRVNMSSGTVLSAEALIRWRHPELGLLLPDHFLPVVEGNLLIVELGEWVIGAALAHMERWREEGLDIPVSVNIDAMQLQEPRFVERLKELLTSHPNVQPSKLELEVLERSAFQDIAQVSEVIRACSKLGVSFALDDFGTGYSSLSYLKRLPVDVLKIDQSFVHDMLDDPEDLTILEGVLVLANAFRRQAVAEGVETVDHGLMLLRLGCPVAQGFGIARPMPGSELAKWAADWRPDPRWANVPAVDPGKWPILYASVEHRAWVAEVEEFLLGNRLAAPRMDHHLCRFGSWLDGEASAGRSDPTSFQVIDQMHQKLHAHANRILDLKGKDVGMAAPAELTELHTLRDGLLEKLQFFVQSV
jgi:diguanylate cyclase (GGDEF)-like protein/PAS domain S-box-containing protein